MVNSCLMFVKLLAAIAYSMQMYPGTIYFLYSIYRIRAADRTDFVQ